MVAKLSGLGAALVAYLAWAYISTSRNLGGGGAIAITAFASYFFCLLAFVLGLQSVSGEVSDHTAEALVMTPISRYRVIFSKIAGSSEFVLIAALLLPMYCFMMSSGYTEFYNRAILHGGMFRCWVAFEASWDYGFHREQSYIMDAVIGMGAFAADLSWYSLLVAIGAWAGISRRHPFVVWLKGLSVGALVLVGLTAIEWAGLDFSRLLAYTEMASQASLLEIMEDLFNYSPFFNSGPYVSPTWTATWILISVTIRLAVAAAFLRRAAVNFDQIATD